MLTNIAGLKERLETGIDVIEFGCGSGQLLASLATSYPKSRFTASDVAPELVDKLRGKWGHLANMSFEIHNLCRLGETMQKKYDWVYSVNVIHDLSKPQEALDGMRGIVEEGNGVCSVIEPCMSQTGAHAESVGNSAVAAFYGVSTFMCVPESFQEDNSVALGMCVGKKGIVDRLLKAKFKVEDFKALT
ncbi:uncharacterized protein LOC101846569 [Aplysia californica]|uniref:Uncharacterized protein LOC101846569 n=1 Tax=Aplysia californica TaxID=6500 RepID=A0ABM0JIV2_APLCA|nr:uncharacterized protein LOC101846569 [Aplysia californica]